jgi:hypothetical protein
MRLLRRLVAMCTADYAAWMLLRCPCPGSTGTRSPHLPFISVLKDGNRFCRSNASRHLNIYERALRFDSPRLARAEVSMQARFLEQIVPIGRAYANARDRASALQREWHIDARRAEVPDFAEQLG